MNYSEDNKNKLLASIESCKIVNYKFDLENHKISFDLEYGKDKHLLIIEKVSSFCSFEDLDYLNITWKDYSYLEITTLWIDNVKLSLDASHKEWFENYSSAFNICIEIWEQLILVKGERIIIDENVIELC